MLTNKQTKKIDRMVKNYRNGLLRALNIPEHLANAYADRYRIGITQDLLRQGKH